MAQLALPVGKYEFNDGTSWFSLASENWVLNTIGKILPCAVATTANLTATYLNGASGVGATLTNSGSFTTLAIDGGNLIVGNRVLVKNQTSNTENGIYTVTNTGSASVAWVLTRATDLDFYTQFIRGLTVGVFSGAINSSKIFMLTSAVSVNIGSAAVVFSELSSNGLNNALGTSNQITVTVASNVATVSISANPVLPGTASVTIPTGTTAQRPATPTTGMLRLNTSLT
jgi:hypothetical protein